MVPVVGVEQRLLAFSSSSFVASHLHIHLYWQLWVVVNAMVSVMQTKAAAAAGVVVHPLLEMTSGEVGLGDHHLVAVNREVSLEMTTPTTTMMVLQLKVDSPSPS